MSHLGPALASIVTLKEMGEPWRAGAERLLRAARSARAASTTELWRDQISVEAYAGRAEAIAKMSRYTCGIAERYLERALSDEAYASLGTLRSEVLAGPSNELRVPLNRVMVATFFLVGMDIAHRVIRWFDQLDLAWERTMVLVAGQAGRPTAGVTVESNSVAGIIKVASRGRLTESQVLIAPHAPAFTAAERGTAVAAAAENRYRQIWSAVEATISLGSTMFDGYPTFARPRRHQEAATDGAIWEKPPISGVDDWFALVARLRFVLEDPRQLLSGAVTDYAAQELVRHGNDPRKVTVPGLDGEPY